MNTIRLQLGITWMIVYTILLIDTTSACAQQPLSLEQAIERVEHVHPDRMRWSHTVEAQRLRAQGWLEVPPVQLSAQIGQYNSEANDNLASALITLSLPPVYTAQRGLAASEYLRSFWGNRWNRLWRQIELARLYYEYLYWQELATLYERIDSLMRTSIELTQLQREQGEISSVHVATVRIEHAKVSAELLSSRMHRVRVAALFNHWMGVPPGTYVPATVPLHAGGLVLTNDTTLHPFVAEASSTMLLEQHHRDLAYASMLPSVQLGYTSMTLTGYHNVTGIDRYYGPGTRFGSVNIGVLVSLPTPWLFARLRAADQALKAAQWEYITAQWELQRQQQEAHYRLAQADSALAALSRALEDANFLITTASAQLRTGTISLLEWTRNVVNALSIYREYLDALRMRNNAYFDVQLVSPLP